MQTVINNLVSILKNNNMRICGFSAAFAWGGHCYKLELTLRKNPIALSDVTDKNIKNEKLALLQTIMSAIGDNCKFIEGTDMLGINLDNGHYEIKAIRPRIDTRQLLGVTEEEAFKRSTKKKNNVNYSKRLKMVLDNAGSLNELKEAADSDDFKFTDEDQDF